MSQCPHCRGLRKSRSSHVQCECGAKPHGREECLDFEGRSDDLNSDPGSDSGVKDEKTCCCTHGMRCTCALKKEHLEPVPEIDMASIPSRRSTSTTKPRLLKAGSENSMTVFTNGHHKPVHKHNDSAHKCGLPYKIPIPHSVPVNEYARRSTDSLPLIRKKEEAHSQLHESIRSAQEDARLVRSEHGSPEPRARFRDSVGDLPPLEMYPFENGGQYAEEYSQSPGGFENYYTGPEEPPMLSAGVNMPIVDWGDMGTFSTSFSQPPSYASYDHSNVGQPALTTSSSGDISEQDDYVSHGRSLLRPDLASTSAEDINYNRLSSSSFTSLQQPSALSSGNLNDLDYGTYLHKTASPSEFEEPAAGGSELFVRHGFTVHDAQKLAHPETPTEAMSELSLPPHSEPTHVWAHHYEGDENSFVPQKGEDDWVQ